MQRELDVWELETVKEIFLFDLQDVENLINYQLQTIGYQHLFDKEMAL
jgi:hypothetical protein